MDRIDRIKSKPQWYTEKAEKSDKGGFKEIDLKKPCASV
jgi:hypothetical protein